MQLPRLSGKRTTLASEGSWFIDAGASPTEFLAVVPRPVVNVNCNVYHHGGQVEAWVEHGIQQ